MVIIPTVQWLKRKLSMQARPAHPAARGGSGRLCTPHPGFRLLTPALFTAALCQPQWALRRVPVPTGEWGQV